MHAKMKEEEYLCSEDSSTTDEEELEEELALFKDMRAREQEDFLQRLSDDSGESISIKLGSFSSFKFYMSGKRDEMPNADIGRTDYNWLLTPPGTPLFSTLDKETPHVEISERSKLQSKPGTIPRISRTGSSPRRMQSSSSPQRSSPISSSCSINSYSRGRASSSAQSSRGNLNFHHSTSTVRSSTATANSSTASARSSAPSSMFSSLTCQRSSTGSTSSGCSTLVGKAAPLLQQKNRRGTSSPCQRARQMIIPGFSPQLPPNLCTRISDPEALLKRCSSPVSRYKGEAEKKSRRQSASPTFSRTGSSSENHDCDPYISQNKDHRMSSGTNVLTDPRPKIRQGSHESDRAQSRSKGPGRSESASKVSGVLMSKRFPNSRAQQRNLRQNSRSMFRPLLSNVPVTSFYSKKATPLLYQGNTDNSSVSSNCTGCITPITEVPDYGNKYPESESRKCSFSHDQEKIKDIKKMEVKSRGKNVFREEFTYQDSQSCAVQMHRCLQDRISVQSALGDGKHDTIGTSQVDLRSEFQCKESCTCCEDRDDDKNCIARENAPVQDMLDKVLVEGKAELSSRWVDSFKISTRKDKDNLQDQEAEALDIFDLPGKVHYFKGSCNGLNNDEIASSSKLNDKGTQKLDVSRLDLEDLASKAGLEVASGGHSDTYKAEVLCEGATIKGSIDSSTDVVGDRCIKNYTAAENTIAETEGRTNFIQHKDLETYLGEVILLQESLSGSQKDGKSVEGIAQGNNQDANCLPKDISSLEMQEQKYCCSKRHELSENSGCFLSEKNRVDSVTQPFFGTYKQEKECTDSGGGSVTIEIGDSLQASVTLSPSNFKTAMEHPASATLEGNTSTDGSATLHVPEGDKAQEGHVSQGDGVLHGNAPRRCLPRSMTLEEATDTVLFCSSIVHDVVYKSTMIAMQKEIVGFTPTLTTTGIVGTSQVKCRNFCRGASAQRMLTYKSINSRKTVAHLHTPSSRIKTTIEDQQPVMHVSIGERNESPMPNKVNSKCHCSIL